MSDIEEYVKKLGHPILEIRERALNSISQKVKCKLVTSQQLTTVNELLPNLLKILNQGPQALWKSCISLLRYMCQDAVSKKRLKLLGGLVILQDVQNMASVDLLPAIKDLLRSEEDSNAENCTDETIHGVPDYSPKITKNMNYFNDTAQKPSSEESYVMCHGQLSENSRSNYESVDDSCLEETIDQLWNEAPQFQAITFTTFPWLPLTSSDCHVLESTTQSLMNSDEDKVIASLHFLKLVLMQDFPPEVLLQRPTITQAVYGCMSEDGPSGHRMQGPACECLITLSKQLKTRVEIFRHPHHSPSEQQVMTPTSSDVLSLSTDMTGGNSTSSSHSLLHRNTADVRPSGDGRDRSLSSCALSHAISSGTVHETDDGDEFILLGAHQLTVTTHCCCVLESTWPLLVSGRPQLQSLSLNLIQVTLDLLSHCTSAPALWTNMNVDSLQQQITDVIIMITKEIIKRMSDIQNRLHHRKLEVENKYQIMCFRNLALVLSRILIDFVPVEEASKILDEKSCNGLQNVLIDSWFSLECSSLHQKLLEHLKSAKPTAGQQIESMLHAAKLLKTTATFMSTSSTKLQDFIMLAEQCIEMWLVHQSPIFVEKLVRGLAKQGAHGQMSPEYRKKAENLLLDILSFPDATSRLLSHKSILHLVEESIGVSCAADVTKSRSVRVLLLLSPPIIKQLLYGSLIDYTKEVMETSKNIVLSLLRGKALMTGEVWQAAAKCWKDCLNHIVCVASTQTHLGRAVLAIPRDIFSTDPEYKLLILKFHLQCLYIKDGTTRRAAFQELVHLLLPGAGVFHPDPYTLDLNSQDNVFLIQHPITINSDVPLISIESSRLLQVLDLIMGSSSIDREVQRAAWSQLAFILQDPRLHATLLCHCSLEYLITSFVDMLKVNISLGVTLQYIPGIIEVLRQLAIYSSEIRITLANAPEVLLCILRSSLIHHSNEHLRSSSSCLMFFLLFNDVIKTTQKTNHKEDTSNHNLYWSVPELLIDKLHLPFRCDKYRWPDHFQLSNNMRIVLNIVHQQNEKANYAMEYLQIAWLEAHAGGLESLTSSEVQTVEFSEVLNLRTDRENLFKSFITSNLIREIIYGVENGTSHIEVKKSVNMLKCSLLQLPLLPKFKPKQFFSELWSQAMKRFVTSQPNSTTDEQLLCHVIATIDSLLQICGKIDKSIQQNWNFVLLLVAEFSNSDSAFNLSLCKSGQVHWVASDSNPRALLSIRLFASITALATNILCIASRMKLPSNDIIDNMSSCVSCVLVSVIQRNSDPQYYPLAVLGTALDCLAHITSLSWPGQDVVLNIVPILVRLISHFHSARGLAHNSFMGRSVTLRSALVLLHIVSNKNTQTFCESDSLFDDVSDDWSWLVSLWVYRDSHVTSIGLNLAAALASTPRGSAVLHSGLTQVSGGVWGAALNYLLAHDRSSLERTASALLLINLSRERPSQTSPWVAPVIADPVTRETSVGVPALLILLVHCKFYPEMLFTLSQLYVVKQNQPLDSIENDSDNGDTPQPTKEDWDLSLSTLSSFNITNCVSESSSQEHRDDSMVSLQLFSSILQLFKNILMLSPKEVTLQIDEHNIIDMVIKQLRYVIVGIKSSLPHLYAVEAIFALIEAYISQNKEKAPELARDSGILHMSLVILASDVESISLKISVLEVLTGLVYGGGWGTAHAVEWIAVSSSTTLPPLVQALHPGIDPKLQYAAANFLVILIYGVINSKHQESLNLLKDAFDSEIPSVGNKITAPGCDLSHHIIHLLCIYNEDKENSNPKDDIISCKTKLSNSIQSNLDLNKILQESLKLLLLVSLSGKEASYSQIEILLPFLSSPISNFQEKLNKINIHITPNLDNKKEYKACIENVINALDLCTNWVSEDGLWVQTVGETLVPLLHPLWLPVLKMSSMLTSVLKFLINATVVKQVCLFLTRTTGLPGVPLSNTRTGRPLLAGISVAVKQQFTHLSSQVQRTQRGVIREMSIENLTLALTVLTNSSRFHECATVISKHELAGEMIKWLSIKESKQVKVAILKESSIKLLAVLTIHQEVCFNICKVFGWVEKLNEMIIDASIQEDALLIIANMAQGKHASMVLLASEHMLKTLVSLVDGRKDAHVTQLGLMTLWSLAANNMKGQAKLKNHTLTHTLYYLSQTQPQFIDLCQGVLALLEK